MGKTGFYLVEVVVVVVVVVVLAVVVVVVVVVVVIAVAVNQLMACTQVALLDTELLILSTLK
jgi:type II secretory pathway pseudopilin PulG